MPFRVVKQLYPAPSSSSDFTDPPWAMRNVYVAKLSGSNDQVWEFNTQASASAKMTELSDADGSGRLYKVIEV